MIGYIRGNIVEVGDGELLILPEIGGVGYSVSVVGELLDRSVGSEVSCFVHHHITDMSQKLFGFSSSSQKKLFLTLIGVNGLGPKGALSLLSLGEKNIIQAISEADEKEITRAQGVGPKLAKKIILELSGKLTLDKMSEATASVVSADDEILVALQAMGYDKKHILKTLSSLPSDIVSVEEKTLYCIKQMATR